VLTTPAGPPRACASRRDRLALLLGGAEQDLVDRYVPRPGDDVGDRGVQIGSLASELSDLDPAARSDLAAAFQRWISAIREVGGAAEPFRRGERMRSGEGLRGLPRPERS
jgi:hypothetical protein